MPETRRPLVIGHRGACGYRPEHTLASYRLAIELGADCIEPDLVSTMDGVLVARHESELSRSTDVAGRAEFAERRTVKVVDGQTRTGWFVEDFTLAEVKRLRAVERLPDLRPMNTVYDGHFEIATWEEILFLARRHDAGVVAELKHPAYFRSLGLSLVEPLLAALTTVGRPDPLIVESFETPVLHELAHRVDVALAQLVDDEGADAHLLTPRGLREIAGYAQGVAPHRSWIVPRDRSGRMLPPTTLVDDAHAAGLSVLPFTFRPENQFLPIELRGNDAPADWGDSRSELSIFFGLGVDGVFTDHPDIAVRAREDLTRAG